MPEKLQKLSQIFTPAMAIIIAQGYMLHFFSEFTKLCIRHKLHTWHIAVMLDKTWVNKFEAL
jgi:hypothetical protein